MAAVKIQLFLCLALVLSGYCHADIIYPKAPNGGQQIVYKYAGGLSKSDPRLLDGFPIEELTIADPFENYYVGLPDLASGKFLSATESNGYWTYVLLHGTNAVGAAGLITNEKTGNTPKFTALYQTDHSNEALRIAQQLPQVKKSDYELRYLDIAPILFRAIWLHGKSDDIIIPLPPTFGRWNAYQPYSENELIKLLKPEAKKKLKEPPGMLD
jgi:hypothetical protein